MSFALERKLIETAYAAAMPAGSAIQFENTPFAAPAAGYTRISVMSGGEGRPIDITAAANRSRTPGVIDVSIFVPPDSGTAAVRAIADQVAAAIAHKTLTEGTTRIITFGPRLDLIGRAGDWFQANVTVRYERDTM
jgi:hypothetical protein